MAKIERDHRHPQMTFLTPADAELLHKGRIALAELVAIYETRNARRIESAPRIMTPAHAYEYLRFEMEDQEREQLRVLNLNQRHRVISAPLIYQGSLHTTVVRIAEVFRPAIIDNAAAILVAHNHPSGEPEPSREDCALTHAIAQAGKLLDIELVDHIVIGQGRFVSLRGRNLF